MRRRMLTGNVVSSLCLFIIVFLSVFAYSLDGSTSACLPGVSVLDPDLFCNTNFRCPSSTNNVMSYTAVLDDEWACRCCPSEASSSGDDCELAELSAPHCTRYAHGAWSASYGLCAECEYGYVLSDAPNPSAACVLSCATIVHCTDCGIAGTCRQCERGYVLSDDVLSCETCPSNCLDCVTADSCRVCEDHYTLFDGSCVACDVDHCGSCSTANVCSACMAGYMLADGRCVPCQDQHCVACATGTSVCTACSAGYTPLSDGSACVECLVSDCAQCNEANVCSACRSGYSLSVLGGCDICLVDQCNVCQPGTDGETCLVCDDGYKRDAKGLCVAPQSWGFLMSVLLGIGAAALALIVLMLWCTGLLHCFPKSKHMMPLLEGETHLPLVGSTQWRDDSSLTDTPNTFFEKNTSLYSHDLEMYSMPTKSSLRDSPDASEKVEKLSPGDYRAVTTVPSPPRAQAEPPAPSAVNTDASPPAQPATTGSIVGDTRLAQRRRRTVQFVLDDDITDRYVPSASPILANAMWDVVVAPMPQAVVSATANPLALPTTVTYDDVQPLSFRSDEEDTTDNASNTMRHHLEDGIWSPQVSNPLAASPACQHPPKPSRRTGLSADNAGDDSDSGWDYGTLSGTDGVYEDIAF